MTSTAKMTYGPAADEILLSSGRPARPRTWGRLSRPLGLLSLIAGLVAAASVGLTIVPAELEAGRYLTDTPAGYQVSVLLALTVLLLTSLVGGGRPRDRHRVAGAAGAEVPGDHRDRLRRARAGPVVRGLRHPRADHGVPGRLIAGERRRRVCCGPVPPQCALLHMRGGTELMSHRPDTVRT